MVCNDDQWMDAKVHKKEYCKISGVYCGKAKGNALLKFEI